MLSKLIVAGTTAVFNARVGKYYGARLSNTVSGGALTVYDATGTADVAATNEVDRILCGVAAGTLQALPSYVLPKPVNVFNGLSAILPTAGTATIFFE